MEDRIESKFHMATKKGKVGRARLRNIAQGSIEHDLILATDPGYGENSQTSWMRSARCFNHIFLKFIF
jgi:hypothetical protein